MPRRPKRSARNSAAALAVAAALSAPARAQDGVLSRLDAAYPDAAPAIAKLAASEAANPAPHDPLTHATLADLFRQSYPAGAPVAPPPPGFDPGRYRDQALFDLLYGDCRKGQVASNLVDVVWLPKTWGHVVRFTERQGAADALRAVSAEIDAMPLAISRAAWPTAGTYACRRVADNGQPSMHAYAAAIDLNLRASDYWLWRHSAPWVNRMPPQIVAAFERHGFIWGGRWSHYDTMHFEYRPELFVPK